MLPLQTTLSIVVLQKYCKTKKNVSQVPVLWPGWIFQNFLRDTSVLKVSYVTNVIVIRYVVLKKLLKHLTKCVLVVRITSWILKIVSYKSLGLFIITRFNHFQKPFSWSTPFQPTHSLPTHPFIQSHDCALHPTTFSSNRCLALVSILKVL